MKKVSVEMLVRLCELLSSYLTFLPIAGGKWWRDNFYRLQGYDLALKRKEVLSIAECILEATLHQAMDLRGYVFGKSLVLTAVKKLTLANAYDMTTFTAMLNHHKAMTMHVTEEDTAGYGMLAIYTVHFATILSGELNNDFKYYSQFRVADNFRAGQNPTTDTAVIC